jgi:hypothetical protein
LKVFYIKIEIKLNKESFLFDNNSADKYDILIKDIIDRIIAKRIKENELNIKQKDLYFENVNLNNIKTEELRQVGAEHNALHRISDLLYDNKDNYVTVKEIK